MAAKRVSRETVTERERALLASVLRADEPAVDLLGDAQELAEDDAAELVTATTVVQTGEGGGPRPVVRDVGGTLLGIGAVSVLLLVLRSGWSVDIDIGVVLVAGSVLVVFVGWAVARALFAAGFLAPMLGVLAGVGILAAAGIVIAARLGPGHIAMHDVPVLVLAVGILAPGIATMAVASWMHPRALRQEWDDARWLARFRGGLRARLVPADVAWGHGVEIANAMQSGPAAAEFGHPLVLARELADADRTARARRWWLSTGAGTAVPVVIAVLVFTADSWGAWTVPVAMLLLVIALLSLAASWTERPWRQRL